MVSQIKAIGLFVHPIAKTTGNTKVLHQWPFVRRITDDVAFATSSVDPPEWRHQMETFSALLALCAVNSPVPVNSPHKGQWRGALLFSLIYVWINDWVNNREAGDLRRHRGRCDVNVMPHKGSLRQSPNGFVGDGKWPLKMTEIRIGHVSP